MRTTFVNSVAIVLVLTGGTAVSAQAHDHGEAPVAPASAVKAADLQCRVQAPLPGELAAWARPIVLEAGVAAQIAPGLAIGQAANLTLKSTPQVRYALRPEKPGGSASFGGLIALNVAEGGTYRVAISSGAWIDLVQGGKAVTSIAHGHGPDCSGVRKMVDFPLTPGNYTLQLGANGAPQMTVLVVRLP